MRPIRCRRSQRRGRYRGTAASLRRGGRHCCLGWLKSGVRGKAQPRRGADITVTALSYYLGRGDGRPLAAGELFWGSLASSGGRIVLKDGLHCQLRARTGDNDVGAFPTSEEI
jgi:hypothetical protein